MILCDTDIFIEAFKKNLSKELGFILNKYNPFTAFFLNHFLTFPFLPRLAFLAVNKNKESYYFKDVRLNPQHQVSIVSHQQEVMHVVHERPILCAPHERPGLPLLAPILPAFKK